MIQRFDQLAVDLPEPDGPNPAAAAAIQAILRVTRLREVSGVIGTQPVVEATDFSQNGRH
jgi:hypothetical protein